MCRKDSEGGSRPVRKDEDGRMKRSSSKVVVVLLSIMAVLLVLLGVAAGFMLKKNLDQKTAQKAREEKLLEEDGQKEVLEETPAPEPTPDPAEMEARRAEACQLIVAGKQPLADLGNQIRESAGNGKLVAIDPGHQGHGNSSQEPIGPGASQTKAKVAGGTSGRTTGVPEYQLNLDVSLKLRDELERRGYEVYMIRETNDVDISNAERAQMAAESGADVFVRIHANGSDNTSVAGALTMAPSSSNPYMDSDVINSCQQLSRAIIETYCESTGANNQGVYLTDDMSGLNWCTVPATIVEMGYMTNPTEDTLMQTPEYQEKIVQGIANGIDNYFFGS